MMKAGTVLLATLQERGYMKGRSLTRAAVDGGVSFPTLHRYLAGDIPRAGQSKFLRFLRALNIPVRRFGGLVPKPARPSTRLGRLLLVGLAKKSRTISEAARHAQMPVGSVWAWIRKPGAGPKGDALAVFLSRNNLDPRPFRPFLRAAAQTRGTAPFARYLYEEQRQRGLTWREFVGLCTSRAGVSYKQVWRWARSGRMPSPSAASRLLGALEAPEQRRTEMLKLVERHMVETAAERETSHARVTCRICGRDMPWHLARRNRTYQAATNSFEHLHCRRRHDGWRKLRRYIGGLRAEDCRRFATMPTVPVKCPSCGLVRDKPVNRLSPFAHPSSPKRRRRAARARCQDGALVQDCVRCHISSVGSRPGVRESWRPIVARMLGGRRERELWEQVKDDNQEALKEYKRSWSSGALASRTALPRHKGPTPMRSIGRSLGALKTRRFGLCPWCGLIVSRPKRLSPHPRTMYHQPCWGSLLRYPPYKEQWRGMLQNPRRLALMERDPRTGRWKGRQRARNGSSELRGYFDGIIDRRWWAGAGSEPTPRVLRIGCAAYIRHHARHETYAQVAKRELGKLGSKSPVKVAKSVAGFVEVFKDRAPGEWALVFSGCTLRLRSALAALCPLPERGEADRKEKIQDLARRGTPLEEIHRLTGVGLAVS